jgi:hypothetical protein
MPLVRAEPVLVPTTPTLQPSPLIITAYQAGTDGLNLVQLYNDSDELVLLDGMQLKYSRKSDPSTIESVPLSGRMLPNSHVLIAAVDVLIGNGQVQLRFTPTMWEPKAIWVDSTGYAPVTVPTDIKTDNVIYKRNRTTTGYSTAASALNGALAGDSLEADLLYELPPEPQIEVVEVFARPKTCAPFNIDPVCSDYIKLRMKNGFVANDISKYRVRTGGDESITTSFSLENATINGDYLLLRLRDDGNTISLTNSGGYIWLEDIFGVTSYENTLVKYADAGSEAYIDQSWGLNDQSSKWQWATPNPLGPNIFPVSVVSEPITVLSDCPAGKYRNPETNRCRSIEEAVNALASCDEGKERNPITNRCRSIITTAASTLTPCDTGQERNPLTNRCRNVLAAATSLIPCDEGEERNTETNRCRKSLSSSGSTLPSVKDVKSDTKATAHKWWLAIVAVLLAAGYAVYEWRQEVTQFLHKLPTPLGKK